MPTKRLIFVLSLSLRGQVALNVVKKRLRSSSYISLLIDSELHALNSEELGLSMINIQGVQLKELKHPDVNGKIYLLRYFIVVPKTSQS